MLGDFPYSTATLSESSTFDTPFQFTRYHAPIGSAALDPASKVAEIEAVLPAPLTDAGVTPASDDAS